MIPRGNAVRGLAALRRLTNPPARPERCELCSAPVSEQHQHLVDPRNRRLLCACDACAILFDHSAVTPYRRIPRDVRALPGFAIEEALWQSLAIPIGLVFFFRSSVANTIVAVYPSPGGPAEVVLEEDLWTELAALHPAVANLACDVEALLVNRIDGAREYYLVPIDEGYKLTGLIRRHWTGISGGEELWDEVRLFFDTLNRRTHLN